jgi:hypothetical protein
VRGETHIKKGRRYSTLRRIMLATNPPRAKGTIRATKEGGSWPEVDSSRQVYSD